MARLPLVLEVLRCLEVATVIANLLLPHPAYGFSYGRRVEAWGVPFWMGLMPSRRQGDA
jgi:hypothetical protein